MHCISNFKFKLYNLPIMKSEKEKRKIIQDAINELGELLKKRNRKEDENLSKEEKKRNIVDKF